MELYGPEWVRARRIEMAQEWTIWPERAKGVGVREMQDVARAMGVEPSMNRKKMLRQIQEAVFLERS